LTGPVRAPRLSRVRATRKTERASPLAWIPDARELAERHPFRAELLDARETGKITKLLAAIRARFGVARLDPSVATYVAAALGAERAAGSLRLVGLADALARITPSSKLFGRFGDTPLPAIEIGGANGVPFWLDLASGRVVTLHHDATLYEKAAASRGATLARAMAQLVSVGSALSLEQLLSLAARLHAAFGEAKPSPRPLYARVVIDALGLTPAKARKAFETLPFELFDLRASDLDALPKPGATASKTSTERSAAAGDETSATESAKPLKKGRAKAPHPRLAPLLERAAEITELDLSNTMLSTLPQEIDRFTALACLDLSDNPRLDWDDACARLATLPALREVRLLRCDLEALPEAFAKLVSLHTVDLSGSAGMRGDNRFQNTQALSVLTALPALRSLRLGMYDAKGTAHEVLAAPAFARLESLELWVSSVKAGLPAVVRACPLLRTLRLRGVYASSLEPLARLRSLEELALDGPQAKKLPDLSRLSLRRLEIRRPELDVLDLGGLASLESLDADLGDAEVRSLPTSLRTLTLRTVERPDAALGTLRHLESLTLEWDEPAKKSLALSSMPALREVRARGEGPLGAPKSSLRVLEAMDTPSWLASQKDLERLSLEPRDDVSRALDVALSLPRLASLALAGWHEPFAVPDVFADRKALREVKIVGKHASPMQALERIAEAPSLEVLEVPSGATKLPASLSKRPLRALRYRVPRPQDGAPLDLSQAFRALAPTGLRELVLDGVKTLPSEIAALVHLEALRFGSYTAPRLPDEIRALVSLRHLVMGAQLTAPDRKRVLGLLPRAALRERR
jgi:hypothetical protein